MFWKFCLKKRFPQNVKKRMKIGFSCIFYIFFFFKLHKYYLLRFCAYYFKFVLYNILFACLVCLKRLFKLNKKHIVLVSSPDICSCSGLFYHCKVQPWETRELCNSLFISNIANFIPSFLHSLESNFATMGPRGSRLA